MTRSNFISGKIVWTSLLIIAVMFIMASAMIGAQSDTTRPTILSVSPDNNAQSSERNQRITVVFSEIMDPTTINENTISVMQRTTPKTGAYRSRTLPVKIMVSGNKVLLIPEELLTPSQEFGNVFTVTLTTSIKDLEGNSLARNYIWSFTTGGDAFNTGMSTTQSDQSDLPGPVVSTSSPELPVPVIAPEPATTPSAISQTWMWIAAIGVVLLIVAVTFTVIRLRSSHSIRG